MLKVAWLPVYAHPLPAGHRFPMEKYSLLPEQLLYEGTLTPENLFAPDPVAEADILATHDAHYWHRLRNQLLTPAEIRRIGFPLSAELVYRETCITQGTIQASQFALHHGIAMNVAGGTHHAFTDRGEGFCLLNDIAVAANWLLDQGRVKKILVVDLDVHQGNGTAQIFRHNPAVFTVSMHGASNYPLHKERSDLDIALPDRTEDKAYLAQLDAALKRLLGEVEPAFIFYLSGVDVLATDKLGRLALSMGGCKARDRMVLEACRANRIPVTVSMGGGYSARLADVVEAHANTYRVAQEIFF
ncbi:MAG: histone deacetylase [Ferruginibacter sp.]|nr:histone deacetylase [Cytophagales bacterium]